VFVTKNISFESVKPSCRIAVVYVLPDHDAGYTQISLVWILFCSVQVTVACFIKKQTVSFGGMDEGHG